MSKIITHYPTLKELEQLVWRNLQETFSTVMTAMLEEYDQQISEERDKKRYYLHDRRSLKVDSLFGEIELKRNYYKDRKTGKYVYLLDQCLKFEGIKGFSPLVEEAAIELAVSGPSYRKASKALETFLGYRVISHEAIRQHLLDIEMVPQARQLVFQPVLFVEVDGLYLKRQEKHIRGREEKIAAVHQGWKINGKRVSLKKKRHYVHQGKNPFWEGFESFLMETYDYDPTVHRLVINGDGAHWITACRDYFQQRAFYTMNRYHVARDIRDIFRKHPRYRAIRKALANYDSETLIVELNSAVGTFEEERKEEDLEALIGQLEKYPEALEDYRDWLQDQGIDTTGMRPMGSSEGTMSVFAKRLKNGRSWVEQGAEAMMTAMVAFMDNIPFKTMIGRVGTWKKSKKPRPPKHFVEKVVSTAGETTRDNIMYLKQQANIPVYRALKALKGF